MNYNNLLHILSKTPTSFFKKIYNRIKYVLISFFYPSFIMPQKVKKVRKKDVIEVLFVLNELGCWKTENLYCLMLNHSRFNPRILLVPAKETPEALDILRPYLVKKGYHYEVVDVKRYREQFMADIIFYQKPYEGVMEDKYFFLFHLNSLFCYVLYGFRNRNYPQIRNNRFVKFIWQFYAENNKVIEESIPVFSTKGKNLINTGLSFMDDLLLDKSHYLDPWKNDDTKKRIIYAPHHTIVSDIYEYATFLDYCDFMLEMAEKYKDSVQWAFKPHPVLKNKLYQLWGAEKTDLYYNRWETMANSQLSEGDYMGLFKYSDAMIHDCGSFRLEYLYTNNPVMFLQKKDPVYDYINWQASEALNLHYKGFNNTDIESFIQNVINGKDPLKDKRKAFVDEYLTPPNNKTACQNIINAILGIEDYEGT